MCRYITKILLLEKESKIHRRDPVQNNKMLIFFSAHKSHHLAGICQFNLESYHLYNFQHGLQSGIQKNYFWCSL